jgi:predicted Fe-S protein YdhL (DUF1289 family)
MICVLDSESGLCMGCRRSLDEISGWGRLDDAERQRIMDALPARTLPPAAEERLAKMLRRRTA